MFCHVFRSSAHDDDDDDDDDDVTVDCGQVTMLFVVPPLIDKVLQTVNSETLRLSLSTVRCIISGAVGLSDNTARQILQVLPEVHLLQGINNNYRKRCTGRCSLFRVHNIN